MARNEKELKIIIEGQNKSQKAFKQLNGQLKGMNKGLSSLKKAAIGVGAAIASKAVFDFGKDAAQAAANSNQLADTLKERLGGEFKRLVPTLKEVSGGTVSSFELMQAASKAMELGVTKDVDKMAKVLEVARIKGRKMGVETTAAFNDLVTGVGRGSPLILDNLGILIPDSFKEMAKTMDEATKKEALLDLIIASEELGNTTVTTAEKSAIFAANIADLKGKIGNLLLPVMNFLLDAFNKLIGTVTNALNANDGLAKSFVDKFNAIKNVVLPVMTAVFQKISIFWEEIKPQVIETATAIWQVIKTVFTFISNFMRDNWDTIKLVIVTTLNVIMATVKNVLKIIQGIFQVFQAILKGDWQLLWDGLKNIASGAIEIIKAAFGGLVDVALGILKGSVSLFFDVGKAIVRGIINGIASAGSALFGKMKNLASGALKAAKSVLGIKSPSKEFMQIGDQVGSGMLLGLKDSFGKVKDFMGGTSQGLLDTASSGLNIGTPGGFTQQIQPAVATLPEQQGQSFQPSITVNIQNVDSEDRVKQLENTLLESMRRTFVFQQRGLATT